MEDKEINWNEIIDNVFYDNYVKGDPSKFLNKLETVLKEKGYGKPISPKRPNTFGMNTSDNYLNRVSDNRKAFNAIEGDKVNRPLDRYIMQDILVDKFFNGNQDAAGKFYQEWLKTRVEYLPYKDYDGSEMNIFKSVEDVPIWTPNDDVVNYMGDKVYFDYLFGGRHYKTYKEKDEKRKEDEEYEKNTKEGKYQDVCPQCRSSKMMPWVSSDADYPKGMIEKSELCKKCNPEGETPTKMSDWSYGYYCPICKNPSWVNLEDIEEGQKCSCSFEKLKDVYDRYVQFEDYESLENMKKNKLYNWFFEKLGNNQKLNEHIRRIKNIMRIIKS